MCQHSYTWLGNCVKFYGKSIKCRVLMYLLLNFHLMILTFCILGRKQILDKKMNADDDEAVIQPTERTRDNSIFGKVRWKFDYLLDHFLDQWNLRSCIWLWFVDFSPVLDIVLSRLLNLWPPSCPHIKQSYFQVDTFAFGHGRKVGRIRWWRCDGIIWCICLFFKKSGSWHWKFCGGIFCYLSMKGVWWNL